jgi:hypothetical protein
VQSRIAGEYEGPGVEVLEVIDDGRDRQDNDEHIISRDLLSIDHDRLWFVFRNGCLKDENACVVDCPLRIDQSETENKCQASSDKRVRTVAEVAHYDRVISEWCCGHDNLLGHTSRYSNGCKVVRLTIDDHLRTFAGLQKALHIIKRCPKGRTLLCSAMPCAGGSPWRTLNVALGVGLEKIKPHWRDFRVLWDNFVIAAKAVIDIGGIVAVDGKDADIGQSQVLIFSISPSSLPWTCVWACYPVQSTIKYTREEALEML